MFLKEYKLEIAVGSGLALIFVYLFHQLMTIKPRVINPADKISFEMARPQQDIVNEFTLEGRDVDSRFENPFVKKGVSDKDKKALKPNVVPIKKTVDSKKKELAKKDETKKTGITTNVVLRDQQPRITSEPESGYSLGKNKTSDSAGNNEINLNENRKKEDEKNKKTKRSIADFVDLLTNPRPERVNQFISAFKNKEIETSEFYSFVNKMLVSEKPEVQGVGIFLAYYLPTYESFKMVVVNQDKMSPEVKTYSDQFLASFNQPNKLPVLAQALQSNDIKVVVKAGELVILGLQNIKNGQTIDYGDRSNRGNNEVKSSSFLGFFLPIAESLKSSADHTIAGIGSALSQQLSQLGQTP